MSFAYVNSTTKFEGGGSTTITSDAFVATAGRLITVWSRCDNLAISTVTDTAGGTYAFVRRCNQVVLGGTIQEVWECLSSPGHATNVVTVTYTSSTTNRGLITVQHSTPATYSLVAKIGPNMRYDQINASDIGTISNVTNALCLMGMSKDATGTNYTAGTSWTERAEDASNVQMVQDQIVTSATTVTFEMTGGVVSKNNAIGLIYAEPAAASGGGAIFSRIRTGF